MKTNKLTFSLSPIALLTLAACKQGYTSTFAEVIGKVEDGPLHNAIAFLDYNNDGILNTDEPSERTGTDGSYSLSPTRDTYAIVAVTDENTVDTISGSFVPGITLKAPKGSSMVTPTTTLMEDGGLTAQQVVEVLGLPTGMDPLTFSAHAVGVDPVKALAVEKTNQQVLAVVNSFAAAAEGSGVSETVAFSAALMSLAEVINAEASKDTIVELDLSNSTTLTKIETKIVKKVLDLANSDLNIKSNEFTAIMTDTVKAAGFVNSKIKAITDTDLKSAATKDILSTSQVLKDQIKTAAEATVENNANKGVNDAIITANVAFASDSSTALTDAISNKAPTDITLNTIYSSELLGHASAVRKVTTTDDQANKTAFTYTIAKINGTDYAYFTIDASTGELSFIAEPNYQIKPSYNITILSTDQGGKTFSKTITLKEPVLSASKTITDNTTTVSVYINKNVPDALNGLESLRIDLNYESDVVSFDGNDLKIAEGFTGLLGAHDTTTGQLTIVGYALPEYRNFETPILEFDLVAKSGLADTSLNFTSLLIDDVVYNDQTITLDIV